MEQARTDKTIKKAETQRRKQYTNGETHEEPPLPSRAGGKGCPRVRDRFRLSRLRTPSVSWLGGTAPRGLPAPRIQGQWHARNFSRLTVARRRRFCTVFPARSLRLLWRSVSSARLQPAGFECMCKRRRLQPAPLNPPNSADAPSLQTAKHGTCGTALTKSVT